MSTYKLRSWKWSFNQPVILGCQRPSGYYTNFFAVITTCKIWHGKSSQERRTSYRESFMAIWHKRERSTDCYVLLTVHLRISLDNGQGVAHLLYFTIRPLLSSTCFEHYKLIIRRLNCIDAASGIVTLSQWPSGAPDGHWLRGIPDAASIHFNSWWWACNARNM
jgi:hypothetical protein